MSTDIPRAAFGLPEDMADINPLLQQMLGGIFRPAKAFDPPPPETCLSLDASEGMSVAKVLTEVYHKVIAHGINSRHPWSLAHMVPPPATISVLADLLIGAMNQCAFIWEEAPLAAAIEAETIRWMTDRVGFGNEAAGVLTSGGTMSNCLATHLALVRAKMRSGQQSTRPCLIMSDQAHLAAEKAVAFNGLDPTAVIRIPTDRQGRLQPGQIRATAAHARSTGRHPLLFICTAGTTNTGTVEPIDEMLEVSREFQAWCHIDAAHGGLLCLRTPGDPAIASWRKADSISWDPHKSMYVSYAIGALLLRNKAMLAPLEFHGEYALKKDETRDAGAFHFEGSRRFDALKLWMTIKHLGIQGFAALTEHTLSLARELAERIRALEDFVLVTEPDTNIVCFRFVDPRLSEAALNTVNIAIQQELFRNGGPLLSSTKIGDVAVLRVVLLNPLVESSDLDSLLDCIRCEARRQARLVPYTEFAEEVCYEYSARH